MNTFQDMPVSIDHPFMASTNTQKQAAKAFVREWSGKGYEKGETQRFWFSLLHTVFGIDDPTKMMEFELPVKTITKEKGNEVSGKENLDFYLQLNHRHFSFEDEGGPDHIRQVREMMNFIGQHNYLTFHNGSLFMASMTEEQYRRLFESLQPFDSTEPINNELEDFLQITKISSASTVVSIEDTPSLEDFQIVEGRRVFQSHFSRERNSQLRRKFIERNPVPLCDVYGKNMQDVYPWTDFMLEIHHITPLSSSFEEGHGLTTSSDVVGLCPSCHRAIHVYYRQYLTANSKPDFDSKDEARQVYSEAKESIR